MGIGRSSKSLGLIFSAVAAVLAWQGFARVSAGQTTAIASSSAAASGVNSGAPGALPSDFQIRNEQLQEKIDAMQQQVDGLKQQIDDVHHEQLKALDNEVLLDIKAKGSFPDGDADVGYNDGFFIRQGDDFQLKFNGLFDYRYSYAHDENRSGLPSTALGDNNAGDFSGFSISNAQLSLSGYVFHNVIFKMMGNFGGITTFNSTLPASPPVSPAPGTFQLNEVWGGYSFSPGLNIRGGSLVIPLVPERTLANYGGQEFPEFADVSIPFGPGYGLGADVYGALVNQTVSYDVMIGDGSNSLDGVDSGTAFAGRDNRLSAYTREQWAGGGKLSDFLEEPDLQNHQSFVWILGGGMGFESQNSASADSSRTSTKILGLSEPGGMPGFLPASYTLDGNLYRGAIDFRTKYAGWSTFSQVLYQNADNESSSTPIAPGYPKSDVSQYAYFVQTGYFVIPTKLELAGRFGQLYTDGLPHHMDEYEIGLNYYVYGENFKIQAAEKFIPRKAAFTDSYGTIVNTQDLITELQMQAKF